MTDKSRFWDELRAPERVLYEDDRLLVLDKPPGVSVMGERHGTDLVRLAAEAGEQLQPVHRIDKVTSGVVALTRTTKAHGALTRQFAKRQASKRYLAVVLDASSTSTSTGTGTPLPDRGDIDLPLRTASSGRVRVAAEREAIAFDPPTSMWTVPDGVVDGGRKNYPSRTTFEVVARSGDLALLSVEPVTGRRHQIRVHLAWIGYPIAGDPLFASTSQPDRFGRTHLHAFRLGLTLPWVGRPQVVFEAKPNAEFLAGLTPAQTMGRTVRRDEPPH